MSRWLPNLRKDIQSKLDTCNALNDADRDEPDGRYDDGYEESPPMHVGWIAQAHRQGYTNHDNEHGHIPPLRYIFVFAHHSGSSTQGQHRFSNTENCFEMQPVKLMGSRKISPSKRDSFDSLKHAKQVGPEILLTGDARLHRRCGCFVISSTNLHHGTARFEQSQMQSLQKKDHT